MSYDINKNKFLSDKELKALCISIEHFKLDNPRDTLIIKIGLETGARASEILNITKSDIDTENRSILIRGLKGSKDREIPLKRHIYNDLISYAGLLDSEKIFPICYSRLRQIWNKYRTGNKTFHSLRHTFALRLYSKHHNLRLCQVALGHRNIKNTLVYAEYVYSVVELRKLLA